MKSFCQLLTATLLMVCGAVYAAENNPLAGVFPDSVKVIAIVAPGLPAANSQTVDKTIAHLTAAGKKVKVMPNARRGEPCRNYSDNVDGKLRIADIEQALQAF